jgi:Ca2+-binding RTX toxin-like protein
MSGLIRAVLFAAATSTAVTIALPASADAAVVTCQGVRATMVGTATDDVIHGTAGRDVIAGLGGNDTILARGGDDLVCGGIGADHLDGGPGNDRLYGGLDRLHRAAEDGMVRAGDTLRGGRGNDRMDAGADDREADIVVPDVYSWETSAQGVRLDLRTGRARGQGVDRFAGGRVTVVGSAYGDVVIGSSRRDRIDTGQGPDVVHAGKGRDQVQVDDTTPGRRSASDRVWGGDGDDRIGAVGGRDHLHGGPGEDWIEALGGGNDVLVGGSGDDHFYQEVSDTGGPQSINGGGGTDSLQINTDLVNDAGTTSTGTWDMTTGEMTLTLDHAIRLSVLHLDRAILATPGTAWTVTGTTGDDFVSGDANSTTSPLDFDGLAGNDLFRGTDGDDTFDGGPGDDHSLAMFAGDDTCVSVETIDGSDCENVS